MTPETPGSDPSPAADEVTQASDGGAGGPGGSASSSNIDALPIGASTDSDGAGPRPESIGSYRVVRTLGRGGMGEVYEAEQSHPRRPVALKVILPHAVSRDMLRRFRFESEVLGRLEHPGIARVYEAGTAAAADGVRPFFAMELVRGAPLTEFAASRGLTVRQKLELVARIADAVEYAHQRGVIHRDLKPANILVDDAGQPKILDFGVARVVEAEPAGASPQTEAGNVVGTLPYMSPEQAGGDPARVDTRTDVFALGLIAFELLTGRPARDLRGKSVPLALRAVLDEDPPPVGRVDPALRGDIEAIVGKALAREKDRRYAGAGALAADLRRYLAYEPVAARPPSFAGRAVRFVRRNTALTVAVAVAVLALVAGVVVATQQALVAIKARGLAETRQRELERTLAYTQAASGLTADDRSRPEEALAWFAGAAQSGRAFPELAEANAARFRNWERAAWHPLRAFRHPDETLVAVRFHPSGRFLLTSGIKGRQTLWDVAEQREVPLLPDLPEADATSAAWSPDGRRIAVALRSGGVHVRDALDRNRGGIHLAGLDAAEALAFDPAGERLVAGGFGCVAWDLAAPGEAVELPGDSFGVGPGRGRVWHVAFGAGGTRLLVVGTAGGAALFDATDLKARRIIGPPFGSPFMVSGVQGHKAVAPMLVGANRVLRVKAAALELLDLEKGGTVVRTLRFPTNASLSAAAISRDETRVVVGGFRVLTLHRLDAETAPVTIPTGNLIYSVEFSPDGRQVIAADSDRVAKLCSVAPFRTVTEVRHESTVQVAAYSPDGAFVVTAQDGGLARLWSPPIERVPARLYPVAGTYSRSRLSRDGGLLVTAGNAHRSSRTTEVRVYSTDPARGAVPLYTAAPGERVIDADLSADGRLLAYGTGSEVQVVDWAKSAAVGSPIRMSGAVHTIRFNHRGDRLAVLARDNSLVVTEPGGTFSVTLRLPERTPLPVNWFAKHGLVRFSPDDRYVLVSGADGPVHQWAVDTGAPRHPPLGHGWFVPTAVYSEDGSLVATASYDKAARVFDAGTGAELAKVVHPDWVFCVKLSADGRRLLTACRDGIVRIWDWRAGKLEASMNHDDEVYDAAFVRGERWVVTASKDGTARVWDPRASQAITPRYQLGSMLLDVNVDDGGRLAAFGTANNAMALLRLDEVLAPGGATDLDALRVRAEILSGYSFVAGSGLSRLSTPEWLERWDRYYESGAGPMLRWGGGAAPGTSQPARRGGPVTAPLGFPGS